MVSHTFRFVLLLLFLAAVVALQIFLSKRESRVPGLVLPALAFLAGLLVPLNMAAPSEGITAGFILQVVIAWLLGNIPTAIFLAIYFGCREKRRRSRQLDKMNIQDLD